MTPCILVIDSFEEMRLLVVRTLQRVFPDAEITEAHDFEQAIRVMSDTAYDAIIVHRAIGADAKTIIQLFRRDNGVVPIIAVSSMDRTDEVLSAGATAFLNFEEWLRVGTLVADLIVHPAARYGVLSRT
jgi:DNA-binding response OmpR family regulator